MDLNYLFHRQQVSLMMADAAGGVEAQRAHRALAQGYAARIARVRAAGGVSYPLRGL
ncbi:hypothetical protein J2Y58_001861 [Sphingomonas sp. BE138]|uniref:hypothetical protein n=1 Tax=Sphingomonas sp. BE138 TaxID=2817845 RepID=UPI0028580D4A|nr:hypothetical protein [Sphingomonas sp. BE138]MDR6788503.1 hypothetical protein [Sphingomonas sp. BE138]